MIDFSIPLGGLERASTKFNQTAAKIADPGGATGDTASLSSEATALIESRDSFTANAGALRSDDQMTKSLLNILG